MQVGHTMQNILLFSVLGAAGLQSMTADGSEAAGLLIAKLQGLYPKDMAQYFLEQNARSMVQNLMS